MNNKVIAFIIYSENEMYLKECISYIERLKVPMGYSIQVLSISETVELARDYNEVLAECDAKYKVYMTGNSFIINDYFVYDIISLFQQNTEVGMIGVLGNTTDVNKNQIKDCNYGKILYGDATGVKKIELQDNEKFEDAQVVSEVLFITQYDLNWSEGTDEQYLAKQCQKYREKGWKVIIPYQKNIWCLCDCDYEKSDLYCKYKFLLRNIEYWHDLESAEMLKEMLLGGILPVETLEQLMKHNLFAYHIMKWYVMDLIGGTRKPEKYLLANGIIDIENKQKNVMHIVTAFDEKWGIYAGIMLESLYENNMMACIHIHVLQKDIPKWVKNQLELQAKKFNNRIYFYDFEMEKLPSDVKTTDWWTVETYFRLFMIDILPKEIDRVLYLDPDIIVNKPIYDLYFMNMCGKELVSCREFNRKKDGFGDERDQLFAFCMNDKEFEYFNAGVMLIDIGQMRGKISGKDYLELLRDSKEGLKALDQDLMNLMHWKNTGFVDEFRYDFFPETCMGRIEGLEKEEMIQQTAIIHYAGTKPWGALKLGIDSHKVWWYYAVKTDIATEFVYRMLYELVNDGL